MKTEEITNTANIIDSRDVIARIKYLRNELTTLRDAVTEAEPEGKEAALEALADWLGIDAATLPDDLSELDNFAQWSDGSDEAQELHALEQLAEEASISRDWQYGETLIADHYFQEYAEDLANDIGAVPENQSWPCCHIDWEAAADALKQDYTEVNFSGQVYFIRA